MHPKAPKLPLLWIYQINELVCTAIRCSLKLRGVTWNIFWTSHWIIAVLCAPGAVTFRGRSLHLHQLNICCSSSPGWVQMCCHIYSATSSTGGQRVWTKSFQTATVLPTKQINYLALCRCRTKLLYPTQLLHLSAGVTLRLYSGNKVWKEVYSHKRAMFCNQIKRRYSWVFLNFLLFFSRLSSYPTVLIKSKTPTKRWELWQQPGIAMVKYLIFSSYFATLYAIYLLGTNIWKEIHKKSNETASYISPQRANEKTLAFFTV